MKVTVDQTSTERRHQSTLRDQRLLDMQLSYVIIISVSLSVNVAENIVNFLIDTLNRYLGLNNTSISVNILRLIAVD